MIANFNYNNNEYINLDQDNNITLDKENSSYYSSINIISNEENIITNDTIHYIIEISKYTNLKKLFTRLFSKCKKNEKK